MSGARKHLGRVIFWVGWPLLFIYLYPSRRTRVLVVCGEDILVTKDWIGGGDWGLPGGGLHRGELPTAGAVRELREETGLAASEAALKYLFDRPTRSKHGFRFHYTAFLLQLSDKPALVTPRYEVIDLGWVNWRKIYDDPGVSNTVKDVIKAVFC